VFWHVFIIGSLAVFVSILVYRTIRIINLPTHLRWELRKVFSQELGWAPKELHEKGTVLQLEVGSPTGMKFSVAIDNLEFLDEDFSEATGIEVKTVWDKEGADVLLIHSAGDIVSL